MPLRTIALLALATLSSSHLGAQEPQRPRLRYLTTASQPGPVAQRDPLGVPSPDGRWLATHSGLNLQVAPLSGGGPARQLGGGQLRRLHLAWRRDSKTLVVREANRERTWFDWREYDTTTGVRTQLWGDRAEFAAAAGVTVARGDLLELAFGPNGTAAGLVQRDDGRQLWTFDETGAVLEAVGEPGALSSIAWRSDGSVVCVDAAGGEHLLSLDCGRAPGRPDLGEVRGPIALDGSSGAFVGRPNDRGTLDLWHLDLATGAAERLTDFARDTYAPYALDDGRVLFKLQQYSTTIARVRADGGTPVPVTTFQSETPSWDWRGERIAFTFGSWRRSIDDAEYPDIAQHVGTVSVAGGAADAPEVVVRRSYSEDQGMHWSPNGRWIVLHSHANGTDDLWLQPADGSATARPITSGGNETGWPRFSPDGHWIVYPTDYRGPEGDRLGQLHLVGFDQESGEVTQPRREIELTGFDGQAVFAEFAPDSRTIYFEAMHGVGERAIWRVDREGGQPERIHSYNSPQWFSGISLSPDATHLVYIAPAPDGRLQLFRVPVAGGEPVQITFDASDKTHPSWSPRGDQIAFTVFRYLAHFWLLEP